ncbi:MAG TPA: DUF885 domain-containing protein [Nitrolancea sp.]|nr:DUF885 domain-containing protein [Nitrolancea sp.]
MSAAGSATPAFDGWLDDFFASYDRHRPVNATFVGRHEHDHRLPDLSQAGIDAVRSDMHALRQQLATLPDEPLSDAQRIDRQLAAGFLEIQEWEYESPTFWRGDPSLATGEAVFGIISLFLRPFAPLDQRVESAIQRLEALPTFLTQARATVHSASPAWTERAIRECDGTLALLGEGIDQLMADEGIQNPLLRTAADRARQAVSEHRAALEQSLATTANGSIACGEEALDRYLRQGHFLDQSASEIEAEAFDELERSRARLAEMATAFGVASWQEGLARLADTHPSAGQYEQRYAEIWQAARQAALDHDLVSWPDYPIRYVPRPRWTRAAAPSLYFLFYRAPAAFDQVDVVDYLISPLTPEMTPDEQEKLLRSTNDSVITLNHVVHHGGLGHHVQNWNAYRAESRIGQIAAVDCASRIALFCGGTMAEGWACYTTELMDEIGFLTPLQRLSEAHSRLRMAARAIVDVQLHTGRLTLDEAARFYHEQTDMPLGAASQEAIKNSMFPGAALMYLVGTNQIWQLRRERERAEGASFNLRRFHDRFLSYGSIPVALIAEAMKHDD